MTTEGWLCPKCHAGVAPSCVRCPCADPILSYAEQWERTVAPVDPYFEAPQWAEDQNSGKSWYKKPFFGLQYPIFCL